LGGLWSNTFGLLVEDGSLAIGIVISLVVAAAIAGPLGQPELAGWVLLGLLALLLVANVYRAGVAAKRAVASERRPRA